MNYDKIILQKSYKNDCTVNTASVNNFKREISNSEVNL